MWRAGGVSKRERERERERKREREREREREKKRRNRLEVTYVCVPVEQSPVVEVVVGLAALVLVVDVPVGGRVALLGKVLGSSVGSGGLASVTAKLVGRRLTGMMRICVCV